MDCIGAIFNKHMIVKACYETYNLTELLSINVIVEPWPYFECIRHENSLFNSKP